MLIDFPRVLDVEDDVVTVFPRVLDVEDDVVTVFFRVLDIEDVVTVFPRVLVSDTGSDGEKRSSLLSESSPADLFTLASLFFTEPSGSALTSSVSTTSSSTGW